MSAPLMKTAVVIPAFNAAAFLREAIESALKQTHPPAQIVVVNDGSTDDTPAILKSFGDAITVLDQPNAGMAESRNRGAARTSAEWLLFLDADDRLLPDALQQLAAGHRARPAAGVVYGQAVLFGDGDSERRIHGEGRSEGAVPTAARASFWKSALTTPGVAVVSQATFEHVGGFVEEWSITADRDFWIKAGTVTEFAFTGRPVLEKRLHGTNASRSAGRLRIQGARLQLAYPAWCERVGVTPAVDVTPAEIITYNLKRALEEGQFDAAEWLADEAARRNVRSPLLKVTRRLLSNPAWWRTVEVALRRRFDLFQ